MANCGSLRAVIEERIRSVSRFTKLMTHSLGAGFGSRLSSFGLCVLKLQAQHPVIAQRFAAAQASEEHAIERPLEAPPDQTSR